MTDKRKRCLEQAEQAVCTDRNNDYGEPEDNFKDIADVLNVYFGDRVSEDRPIDAVDVANIMVLTKVMRAKTSPYKADHYVDMAGYAACAYSCAVSTVPEPEIPEDVQKDIEDWLRKEVADWEKQFPKEVDGWEKRAGQDKYEPVYQQPEFFWGKPMQGNARGT